MKRPIMFALLMTAAMLPINIYFWGDGAYWLPTHYYPASQHAYYGAYKWLFDSYNFQWASLAFAVLWTALMIVLAWALGFIDWTHLRRADEYLKLNSLIWFGWTVLHLFILGGLFLAAVIVFDMYDEGVYGLYGSYALPALVVSFLCLAGLLYFVARCIFRDLRTFWRGFAAYGEAQYCGVAQLTVRVFTAGALFIGCYKLYIAAMKVIVSYNSSVVVQLGMPQGVAFFFILTLAPLVWIFAGAALSYMILNFNGLKELKTGLGYAVVALVIISMAAYGLHRFKEHYDIGKSLAEIPGVSMKTEPRLFVALLDEPVVLEFEERDEDRDEAFRDNAIPYSEANVKAVSAYLQSCGHKTDLLSEIWFYLFSAHERDLDPESMMTISTEVRKNYGLMSVVPFEIQNAKLGPADTLHRQTLSGLCSPDYMIDGKIALLIGRAFVNFGELDEARYWYNKAVASGYKLRKDEIDRYSPPEKAPFNKGRISGRVTMDGEPASGIRVGLIRKGILCLIQDISKSSISPRMLSSLVAGMSTDGEGWFAFDNLVEEKYVLLLSIRDTGGRKLKAHGGLKIIDVNTSNPESDVGNIILVTEI